MNVEPELHNRVAAQVTKLVWDRLLEARADTNDLLVLMETIVCHLLLLAGREAPESERLKFETALWESIQINVPQRLEIIRSFRKPPN